MSLPLRCLTLRAGRWPQMLSSRAASNKTYASPADLPEIRRQRVALQQQISYLQHLFGVTSAWDAVERAKIHHQLTEVTEREAKMRRVEERIRAANPTITELPTLSWHLEKRRPDKGDMAKR